LTRALLLAAGYGTRLGNIVNTVPKCLLEFNNQPLLKKWLDDLYINNVKEILINTHYLSEKVNAFVYSIKNHYPKMSINVTYEDDLLGTGGTLLKNIDFFKNEDGMLIHADNLIFDSLTNFIKHHETRPKRTNLTIFCFETNSPESCGIVEVDRDFVGKNFYEKSKENHGYLASGACFIFDKNFIKKLSSETFTICDFSKDILPKYIKKSYIYQTNKPFFDIGTPENYFMALLRAKELS